METVLNALQAMKKASAIEISARTGIGHQQVINDLWDLKRAGVVEQKHKTWMLATEDKSPAVDSVAPLLVDAKVDESAISDMLRQHGQQTTEELAKRLSTSVRKVASAMAMPVNKGRIKRISKDGKFCYSLPDSVATDAPVTEAELVTTHEAQMDMPSFLNTIPKFTAPRPDDLIIPTARGISREIRRTQHKLVQLKKMRDAVRQISRHKKLVQELVGVSGSR
jgi:DNA-binding Lrp family transcriptional regulator